MIPRGVGAGTNLIPSLVGVSIGTAAPDFRNLGLYLIVGRFFVDAWQRSRTCYALTNERAIIVSGIVGQKVKSLPLRTMSDITLTERSDGSGSIALGPASGPYGWMAGTSWPGMSRYQPPSFEMIDNVRQVHTLLRDAQTSAAGVRA